MVSNGRAVLHIALLSLDLKEDDGIMIPALAFIAGMNVVNIVGAKPVIVDSDSYNNWNVPIKTIKKSYNS